MDKIGAVLSPRVLSFRDAAAALGISEWYAGELARRGELRSVTLGRRRVVPYEAIDEILARGAPRKAS